MQFIKWVFKLIKIVIPSWKSTEVLHLLVLTVMLCLWTYLSIKLAAINGGIVKTIVDWDLTNFIKRCIFMMLFSVPSSTVNSSLDYLNRRIALLYWTRLVDYFNKHYLNKMVFYQMCNLDEWIRNPDQILTQDIDKWSQSLSNLYSNFSKPLLDIILFSKKLAELVGWQGPATSIGWYTLSAFIIKYISPAFGKLTAIEQSLEGDYRSLHSELINHAE